AVLAARYPMRKIFPVCCASALCTAARINVAVRNATILLFTGSAPHTKGGSLDHFIRSRYYIRRNRKTDLFGGFQIYDKLKRRRSLNRQVSRTRALENLIYVYRSPAVHGVAVCPI